MVIFQIFSTSIHYLRFYPNWFISVVIITSKSPFCSLPNQYSSQSMQIKNSRKLKTRITQNLRSTFLGTQTGDWLFISAQNKPFFRPIFTRTYHLPQETVFSKQTAESRPPGVFLLTFSLEEREKIFEFWGYSSFRTKFQGKCKIKRFLLHFFAQPFIQTHRNIGMTE